MVDFKACRRAKNPLPSGIGSVKTLRELQTQSGAILEAETGISVSFGNDVAALKAVQDGVALYDCSHWGLLEISGDDRLQFLHNQSTNDLNRLKVGESCDTIFVTSTARTLDLATVYVTENSVLLMVSAGQDQSFMEWLDRFLFPMDKVTLKNISSDYCLFRLIGTESQQLLQKFGLELPLDSELRPHQLVTLNDVPIRVGIGSGLISPGYTLIIPQEKAAPVWEQLTAAGAIPMGDRLWEQLRIQQGRPAPGKELTDKYNPLEAGLWQSISFTKGCYIGQETIARLNTYKGVKQKLWGIKLKDFVEPGTVVTLDGEKVGRLTSSTMTEQGAFGLVYIRTQAGGEGLTVQVGESEGEVVAVPFLTHEYYDPKQ